MYKDIINRKRAFFKTGATKTYEYRLKMLKKLKSKIQAYEDDIKMALKNDLGKSYGETYLTEIGLVLKELNYFIKNLKQMLKPSRVSTPLALFPAKSFIYPEPLGVVLIIAPWNYPFTLTITPLIGAIAAGNTVIIKPSEHASNYESLLVKLIKETFDTKYISVITGGVLETTELLKQRFDHIFFTGSSNVGKVVMNAASKYLTPVTLELGGKSPTLVTKTANLKLAARRIAYGKTINAGQTCIAPDYLLIEESLLKDFVKHFYNEVIQFYGQTILENEDYPKIINKNHQQRLLKYLDDGEVLLGGAYNKEKIAPTLILISDYNKQVMKDEIFGPILPIVTYKKIEEAYAFILKNEKPLAAYIFSNNKNEIKSFYQNISAGGIVINDTLMHFANVNLPFGGIGNSGKGKYHGYESFKTFSHFKAVLDRKTYLDLKVRYHPMTKKKEKIIKKILK